MPRYLKTPFKAQKAEAHSETLAELVSENEHEKNVSKSFKADYSISKSNEEGKMVSSWLIINEHRSFLGPWASNNVKRERPLWKHKHIFQARLARCYSSAMMRCFHRASEHAGCLARSHVWWFDDFESKVQEKSSIHGEMFSKRPR